MPFFPFLEFGVLWVLVLWGFGVVVYGYGGGSDVLESTQHVGGILRKSTLLAEANILPHVGEDPSHPQNVNKDSRLVMLLLGTVG